MATLGRGITLGATETVTNTKLHNLVDLGSISGILDADCDASMNLANSKLANIVDSSKVGGSSMFGLASIPSGAGSIPMEHLDASVLLATLQTIPSLKYMATLPIYPDTAPTADGQAANKVYVDTQVATTSFSDREDYSTSTSSSTSKNQSDLKVCYGTVTIAADGTATFTNLPFTSSSSYSVVIGQKFDANDDPLRCYPATVSGASFTIKNTNSGKSQTVYWQAIGT